MIRPLPAFVAVALMPLLSGCLVRAAADVVTAPVRIVSKGADWATTSQSEADEKRGRAMRRHEERLGRLQRDYARSSEACRRGRGDACDRARDEYAEIENLRSETPGY